MKSHRTKSLGMLVALTLIFLWMVGCTKKDSDSSNSAQGEKRSDPINNSQKEKKISSDELGLISKSKTTEWEEIDDPSKDGSET